DTPAAPVGGDRRPPPVASIRATNVSSGSGDAASRACVAPSCAKHASRSPGGLRQRFPCLGSRGFPGGSHELAEYLSRGHLVSGPEIPQGRGERALERRGQRQTRYSVAQGGNPSPMRTFRRRRVGEEILRRPDGEPE